MKEFKLFLVKVRKMIGDEKFEEILHISQNVKLDGEGKWDNNDTLCFAYLLTGSIVATSINAVAGSLAVRLGFIAANAMIPGLGWAAIAVTAVTTIYGLKNQIGLFTCDSCFDDILKAICESIKIQKHEILTNLRKEASNIFVRCIDLLKKHKDMEENVVKLNQRIIEKRDFLNKKNDFNYFQNNNQKIEEIFTKLQVEDIFPDEKWIVFFDNWKKNKK